MSIDWSGYAIYDPGVHGPWQDLPRAQAQAAYERLMEAKPHRIEQLRALLSRNGVQLGVDDASIQDLNDWFRAQVSPDPATSDHPNPDVRCRLLPEWYSVVSDISLFLGDVIISRYPHLRWEFFTRGKSNLSYQQNVITGFDVPNPRYNLNVDYLVAGYAHQIVLGLPVPGDEFVSIVREAGE